MFFREVHLRPDHVIGTLFAWGSLAMAIGLMILSFLVLLLISTASFAAQERGDPAAQVATELAERWGVRVESMRLTAANRMLDFRYTVLDAEKAAPLFVRKTHPKLLHTKSGARLAVHSGAKVGPMRNSNPPVKGKTYFII